MFGFLLLVPIEPAEFRAKYAIADDVVIVGPFSGRLNNAGEDVTLNRHGTLGRQILVDRVDYDDDSPWPEEAESGPDR